MLRLKDLINSTPFETVKEKLFLYYPKMEKYEIECETHFNLLKITSPSVNERNMYIYINVFQNNADDEPELIKLFNEDDPSLYYDVCGKDDEWIGYSLVASKFDKWLGFFVEESSLNSISKESFIAHCLWEMNFLYKLNDERDFDNDNTTGNVSSKKQGADCRWCRRSLPLTEAGRRFFIYDDGDVRI